MDHLGFPDYAGAAIALCLALATIVVDFYQVCRERTWRVPGTFWTSWCLWLISLTGGIIASVAYLYASTVNDGWLDTLLGSKIPDPYIKGAYTGVAVLALIRSKVAKIQGKDFGFEAFYKEAQIKCLSNIQVSWSAWKYSFTSKNIKFALTVPDLDTTCGALVAAAIQYADQATQTSIETQLTSVTGGRPAAGADLTAYYGALISLVLENCGPGPLVKLGFKQ